MEETKMWSEVIREIASLKKELKKWENYQNRVNDKQEEINKTVIRIVGSVSKIEG